MALPLYSLPESNTIRGTGNSFHFLGKQERRKHPQTVRKHFPSSPIPSKSHTAVQGNPSRRSASIPFPWRVGTASIRSGHRRHVRCDRPSARRRRFQMKTTLTHSGKTKPSRMPQKCGGAYVSVQAHPVADLHFRKQAGPCSLMSWKIPHPDIRIRFCFRACPMLLLRLRQRSGQCGWSMFSHPSTMDKTEYPSPLKQSALFS